MAFAYMHAPDRQIVTSRVSNDCIVAIYAVKTLYIGDNLIGDNLAFDICYTWMCVLGVTREGYDVYT